MNQQITVSVGIDWADAKHDFHLIASDGQTDAGEFDQDPQAIADQINAWRKLCPDAIFAVAIEASKGAIINALLGYDDVRIYPVNPAALANYRKAFAHGGGKNDPVDAKLMAQFIEHYRDQLQPLQRDSELTRKIAIIAEDRRRFVDSRADLANQLTALLKSYFPAALALKPARTYSEWFVKFLNKYSALTQAQAAGKTRLRSFFHGVGKKAKADTYATTLCEAIPLTQDAATIETLVMRVQVVLDQIESLTRHIKRYESRLKQLVPQHDLFALVDSLPGAINTKARLIAALGDDRSRYPEAKNLQTASGIAPLTTQSGRQKFVHARWACTKFTKQTYHEFAGVSITKSRWAKVYYEQHKLRHGSRKNAAQLAKRALAYKWQRIIHSCWQAGEVYDEGRYIERLKQTGSPLYALLEACSEEVENMSETSS